MRQVDCLALMIGILHEEEWTEMLTVAVEQLPETRVDMTALLRDFHFEATGEMWQQGMSEVYWQIAPREGDGTIRFVSESIYNAWVNSCLFCLNRLEDQEGSQIILDDRGLPQMYDQLEQAWDGVVAQSGLARDDGDSILRAFVKRLRENHGDELEVGIEVFPEHIVKIEEGQLVFKSV